jgi:hypothetical protein
MEKTPESIRFSPSILSDKILWAYTHLKPGDNYSEIDKRSYTNNSYGHRGPEFSTDVDTLIIGCSYTYGIGLELEETWGHVLSEKLNFSYNLLAFPGGSIPKIVRQAVEWVYRFGKPRRLVALMPEVRRVDLFETVPNQDQILLINANELRKKFNKELFIYSNASAKTMLEDFDYPSLASYSSLNTLEKFCSLLGIELYWSSWDHSDYFSGYSSYLPLTFTEDSIKHCAKHVEVGGTFVTASDGAHPGWHYHLHVAEDFYKNIVGQHYE